jgi:hypothetical protein
MMHPGTVKDKQKRRHSASGIRHSATAETATAASEIRHSAFGKNKNGMAYDVAVSANAKCLMPNAASCGRCLGRMPPFSFPSLFRQT